MGGLSNRGGREPGLDYAECKGRAAGTQEKAKLPKGSLAHLILPHLTLTTTPSFMVTSAYHCAVQENVGLRNTRRRFPSVVRDRGCKAEPLVQQRRRL